MSKEPLRTIWVDNKWEDDELTVFVAGIHADSLGWSERPNVMDTNDWFGLSVQEVQELYFLLGVMLSERHDEAVERQG